ncbi:hypothetical protein LO772_17985 [Yinghuangia sp. ASG 101]|uniref:hypothetical protein n=1 Tax=Yinghuangia sp. ASG 101 TaxID=2896848 RepID=UPI001E637004|nr:hypothetical protein [Yinghuangia sp. ASG 101]UGQ08881.1 hypothetical protein LO772_17985 [Yinghuangia sp. ASG 101]
MTPQDPPVAPGGPDGPDGHVDVDVLSDLVEGLLGAAAAETAETHIASCADCRDTRDALAGTRDLLGSQPAEPMPDDVFAGIQAALAEAAREDGLTTVPVPAALPAPSPAAVTPPRPGLDLGSLPPPRLPAAPAPPQSPPVAHLASARRRRRRTTGWLLAAAVAAVVVGVGIGGGFGGESSNNDAAPGSASAPRTSSAPHDAESGADSPPYASGSLAPSVPALPEYTRTNLTERVDALIGKQSAATGTPGGGNDAPRPTHPVDVPACVSAVVPGRGTPTAAERARFEGKVAYVLVFAGPDDDSARVAIVDAACAEPSESGNGSDAAPPGAQSTRSPSGTGTASAAPSMGAVKPGPVLYSGTVPLR